MEKSVSRVFVHLTALLVSSSLLASRAHSQTVGEIMAQVEPSALARAFIGHCLHNEGDILRIGNVAKLLNFVKLDADMMVAFGAQEASENQTGWLVASGDGAPYLLAVNQGNLDDQSTNICTVSNPFLAGASAVETWKSQAGAIRLIFDETRFGQRERSWLVEDWIEGARVYAIEGTQEFSGGVTLSLIVPTFE